MRVFICLSIFSFILPTCQGKCFEESPRTPLKHGKLVKPNTCIDRYDGKSHPIGSGWKTDDCFVCACTRAGMRCCQRTSGVRVIYECKAGEHPDAFKDFDDECRLINCIEKTIVEFYLGIDIE